MRNFVKRHYTIFYQSPSTDIDNDGIINDEDDDIDGDGIVNSEDDDVDGDGIPDDIDGDIDGDGTPNEDDDTISGYLLMDEFASSILIFPNPSNGVFSIKLLDQKSYFSTKVVVRDLKGNLVFNENKELFGVTEIDLSFLPSSVYFLNIYLDEDISLYQRIIIK